MQRIAKLDFIRLQGLNPASLVKEVRTKMMLAAPLA